MAKNDFVCKNCKKVVTQSFFSLKTFHKYTCPNCGTICEDCVDNGLFKRKCRKCGEKVLRYSWSGNKWHQD